MVMTRINQLNRQTDAVANHQRSRAAHREAPFIFLGDRDRRQIILVVDQEIVKAAQTRNDRHNLFERVFSWHLLPQHTPDLSEPPERALDRNPQLRMIKVVGILLSLLLVPCLVSRRVGVWIRRRHVKGIHVGVVTKNAQVLSQKSFDRELSLSEIRDLEGKMIRG